MVSKKEKKAKAFKEKKNKLDFETDPAVADDGEWAEASVDPAERKSKSKRESTSATEKDSAKEELLGAAPGETSSKKRKAEDDHGSSKKSKSEKREKARRYIVFVGNLADNATAEVIARHFEEAGQKPVVRMRESAKKKRQAKFAFIEFKESALVQSALHKHQSLLLGKPINVELTAGGGGNSEARKQKIKDSTKRLREQRERFAARQAEKQEKKREKATQPSERKESKPTPPAAPTKKSLAPPRGVQGPNTIRLGANRKM